MLSTVRAVMVAALVLALVGGGRAQADDDMDPALYRLRVDRGGGRFAPDDTAFAQLSSQLGFALAPPITTGAATTGAKGFYLGFETIVTAIDSDADYWRRGTRGDGTGAVNRFVNGSLVGSRLHLRKGLPFGIEVGLEGGHFYSSSMWSWGADLKIAILEGFREGWQAFLPDIAIRGAIRTLTGAADLQLTVPSFDVVVSKKLVLGSVFELTPLVGAQLAWILADSEVVDLTPEIDGYAACAPVTTRPTSPTPTQEPPLVCSGDPTDLENDRSFTELRAFRPRLALGLSGRYQHLVVGLTFHMDLRSPNADDRVPDGVARQWDAAIAVGARY